MKDTLIVNLYGGPGTGKSTGAAYIFSKLKMAGIDAEYISEFAKDKVWEGSKEAFKCQFCLSGHQAYRISRIFGKVDVIVTDSPIRLGAIYASRQKRTRLAEACHEDADAYKGHTLEIMLRRVKPYNPNGRNETEEESKALDSVIKCMLLSREIEFIEKTGDLAGYDEVVQLVIDTLAERKKTSEA